MASSHWLRAPASHVASGHRDPDTKVTKGIASSTQGRVSDTEFPPTPIVACHTLVSVKFYFLGRAIHLPSRQTPTLIFASPTSLVVVVCSFLRNPKLRIVKTSHDVEGTTKVDSTHSFLQPTLFYISNQQHTIIHTGAKRDLQHPKHLISGVYTPRIHHEVRQHHYYRGALSPSRDRQRIPWRLPQGPSSRGS